MWQPIDTSIFGDLKPEETFIYYDGPLSFSIRNKDRWFYIHACDFAEGYQDFFARETTIDELESLKENKIQLYDFLKEAPILYLVRENFGKPLEAWIVNADEFSSDNFPTKGVYLGVYL